MNIPSFNSYIQKAIVDNWDYDALTDYKGITLQYHDVARKIEKLHILFENSGIQRGDKIALCGRNSAHWSVAFLATLTYGAVAVPVQNEFTPEQIHNIVNHSEAKLLFVGDVAATQIDAEEMPSLEGIIYIPDYSLVISRSEQLTYAREHLNAMFGQRFPMYFRKNHVNYHKDEPEELALINYTSGTTGFSKGVMLPYRALWGNVDGMMEQLGDKYPRHSNIVSILPMAHMYGMLVDMLLQFCWGNHIFFLTRLPSPTFIAQACAEIKPAIIFSVPLVIEKIIRKKVFPIIQTHRVKLLLNMPVINKRVKERICEMVRKELGDNMYEVVVGGAGLNKEIEDFLTGIGFPITMAYGTTETAPLITYSNWTDFASHSCGTPVKYMEVKILSEYPERIPGEVITKGINLMHGYYKNPEATDAVIDQDGWFHTGDLGTMSADGHLYINGRIKNMLLGSNGQNVFPEEIENILNSMALVSESLIVQNEDKLVALVHPDNDEAEAMGFTEEDLQNIMEQNRQELNMQLPAFCKISEIRLHEEFEKTPKKSIKRYLYRMPVLKE